MDEVWKRKCRKRSAYDPRSRLARPIALSALPLAGTFVVLCIAVPLMVGDLCNGVLEWIEIRSWHEVPTIISILHRLPEHKEMKFEVEYRYIVGGKEYTGNIVTRHWGSAKTRRTRFEELSRYCRDKTSFRCFVDPDDPARSILYRDEMLVNLLFKAAIYAFFIVLISILFAWLFVSWRSKAAYRVNRRHHPDKPWLWNPSWADDEIRPLGTKMDMRSLVFGSMFGYCLACAAISTQYNDDSSGFMVFASIAGVCLFGLGLFWRYRQWKYYFNPTVFKMDPLPAVPGGTLEGTIETTAKLPPDIRLVAALCRLDGRVKQHLVRQRPALEEFIEIPPSALNPGVPKQSIPILFDLPAEEPPTDEEHGDAWMLEVHSITPGCGYWVSFAVPVFGSGEQEA